MSAPYEKPVAATRRISGVCFARIPVSSEHRARLDAGDLMNARAGVDRLGSLTNETNRYTKPYGFS